MKKKSNKSGNCKIILVGESGVGKTCLINRFVKENYIDEPIITIGPSLLTKQVKTLSGRIYDADLWDTAGSERFRSINSFFYHDCCIGVLVYDITVRNSFEAIQSYWADELKKNTNENISKLSFNYTLLL